MYGVFTLTLIKALGVILGGFAIMSVIVIAGLQIWVRQMIKHKIYAIFLDQKHLFSKMLPIEGEFIFLGKGDKKEKYFLDTNKQFWVTWPTVGASLIGAQVRAHWYIRNRPQPVDPLTKSSSVSATSLRMMGDEAMLRTTWKDIRETTGVHSKVRSSSVWLIVGLAILVGLNLYLTLNLQKIVNAIAQVVGVG